VTPPPGDSALAARLRREIEGEVLFDLLTRGIYSTDASIYQIEPVGVVVPRNAEDVRRAVQIAAEAGVPVIPRGGGTGQAGQTIGRGLIVDTSKYLRTVEALDTEARTVTVQPGLVLDHLNAHLAPTGLFFPVDVATASRATLGGMAGNNSAGARSIRYGHTVGHVRAIEAVLADGTAARFSEGDGPPPALVGEPGRGPGGAAATAIGSPRASLALDGQGRVAGLLATMNALHARESDELERRIPQVPRHVAGYNLQRMGGPSPNLADILVGSEGTLAFFTRLELSLAPLPGARVLGICHFASLGGALDTVQHIVTLDPSAVELVDAAMLRLARGNPDFAAALDTFVKGDPGALLVVEFAGPDRAALARRLDDLSRLLGDLGHPDVVVPVVEPAGQARVWEVRKAGLNIAMSMKGDRKPIAFMEDCAIPLPRLAEWEERANRVFASHGTEAIWYAHASVGLLHVRPALNLKAAEDVGRMRAIVEECFEIVRDLGGSHSGEHADGRIRSEFHERMLGSRLVRAFEDVKDAFDPTGLFNPGSVVRPPRMDDRDLFRYGPDYAPRALPTVMDWSEWGGLAGAIEMCNNNGTCRKTDPGVMCPSYRVTQDEVHTTRGRANALRLAVTGQLGPEALSSDALYDAMDLCVGCKGCKRECPTGVDMARMKVEFLHAYRGRHGLPLRDRLVSYLPRYAPRVRRLRPLLSLPNRAKPLAALGERMLGFSSRRPLPEWSATPYVERRGSKRGDGPPVVLLVDTFATWFEPEIARAALRVLAAAGYSVSTVPWPDGGRPVCCGRTFLNAGLVPEAREEMLRLREALLPAVDAGAKVVGLEPSCLLTLRDEAPALLPDPASDRLADASLLLEELLDPARADDGLALGALDGGEVRVHGHCHEKAFAAMGALERVLGRIPGATVDVIASGCCGLAGSFGYEAEHAELSLAMGELDLLPAVRATPTSATLVANGTSCRRQILDGAGREAVHLAELLAQVLV
jgi:FAD/FMN-containing dehydrogenase/Fe-S oxidoreductase